MNRALFRQSVLGALLLLGIGIGFGCAVGQRPGKGVALHLQEPTTGARYWLYLPEDYVRDRNALLTDRRWPLVVTFHGMKPFDNANPQIREWQQEADRYGFVVCAPELKTPDLMYEFPFKRVTPALKRDEDATIAILDCLMSTTDVDANAVLSTSWSSGGYLAHYMVNQHPDRFSCLAVRQSNFSEAILDPARAAESRDHKIAIFFTENDFAVCKRESMEGARWYSRHGFDLTFAKFGGRGHERTPGVAAAFFAGTCGATAKTPPVELARMQVKEVPIEVEEASSPRVASALPQVEPSLTPRSGEATGSSSRPPWITAARSPYGSTMDRPLDRSFAAGPAAEAAFEGDVAASRSSAAPSAPRSSYSPVPTSPVTSPSSNRPTPRRAPTPVPERDESPVRIRVSSTIGVAPLAVSYSAVLPGKLRRGAYYLWTDNGEPISNGINGRKFLIEPGEHRVEVLVTTADGREFRAGQTITILEPTTHKK